jgi:DNA-binding response OmpR family regulator
MHIGPLLPHLTPSGAASGGEATERRALVVETDASIRHLITAVLRRHHVTVDAVNDGLDAIALIALADDDYTLIVVDLAMPPPVSDLTIVDWIRWHDPRALPRVIALATPTSNERPDVPQEICHVLARPFELADFEAAVASCLEKR